METDSWEPARGRIPTGLAALLGELESLADRLVRRDATPTELPVASQTQQLYRILVAFDIERYSRPELDDTSRVWMREAIRVVVERTFIWGGIPTRAYPKPGDTGDGIWVQIDPTVETARIVKVLLDQLPVELIAVNQDAPEGAELRLRAVLHAGHIMLDGHGATGEEVIRLFRILDADELRVRLACSPRPAIVAVSDDIYRQVVRHRGQGLDPADFQPCDIMVKGMQAKAWVHAPAAVTSLPGTRVTPELPPADDDAAGPHGRSA